MNKFFVNTIYEILERGITSGYHGGIVSIVSMNKGKFTERAGMPSPARSAGTPSEGGHILFSDPMFDVDYTKADKDAIRRFKLEVFKVAGVGSWELEEALKKLGIQVMDGTIPDYESFEVEARKVMLNYGIGLGQQPPSGWIETNLNTAITGSMQAARWIRLNDPDVSSVYPALMYRTQRDARVRAEHAALSDRVFLKSDAVWKTIYPPNGWRCRCYTEPLTAEEMKDYDIEETDAKTRKELTKEVEPEFRRNSGDSKSIFKTWLEQKYKDMPQTEIEKLKNMLR